MMTENTALDVSDLCQSCGLCCNGTLFSYAKIYPDEKEKAKKIGLDVYTRTRTTSVFNFPCPHLDGTRCSVYADRPRKCVGYFCSLAKKVTNGLEMRESALEIVSKAKQDRSWLKENAPSLDDDEKDGVNLRDYLSTYQKEAMKALDDTGLSEAQEIYAHRAFEFLKLIDRHFRETSLMSKYTTLIQTIHYKKSQS